MTINSDGSLVNNETTGLLDELFDGVYILDINRNIIFWNTGAENITGYSREQMVGRECNAGPLMHEDELGCRLCQDKCPAARAMEKDEAELAVVYLRRYDGELIPVETHIKPIKDEKGKVIAAIEVFRDASHWKELEELSEEKDRLMGILAHDIRNPLSVVKTYSYYMKKNKDAEIREMGSILQKRSDYALALVNDLLDVQTVESGTVSLNIEEIDVVEQLEQTIANYVSIAQNKRIELVMTIHDHKLRMFMDPMRFEEIFNNLVNNAINYSHPDTKIEIVLEQYERGVSVAVKDQGIGIKQDDIEKLFKAFGKTSNKPTAGERSSGLGLYIVKKIIDLFNGTIQVESEPGVGSTFTVLLPYDGCPIEPIDYQI